MRQFNCIAEYLLCQGLTSDFVFRSADLMRKSANSYWRISSYLIYLQTVKANLLVHLLHRAHR